MENSMTEEEREIHLTFMREALAMASLAFTTSETPVGCVFVHNNTIIGRGMNATNRTYNGTRHAELLGINDILTSVSPDTGEKLYIPDMLKECDLYVTVEPCIMCASLLRQMGIRRVFYGASNDKFGGTGGVLNIQRANGWVGDVDGQALGGGEGDYEVSGGWLREEAILSLRRFYVQENDRAPEPRSKGGRVLKLEVEPLVEGTKLQGG